MNSSAAGPRWTWPGSTRPPRHAFRSEELKQTAPSLDGLLAPEPDGDDPYVFIEVRQGRLDKRSASGDLRRRVDALRRSRRLEAAISFPAAPDEEIQAMLGLTDIDLKQTRFYQDVFAEGQAEGQTEGRRSEAANLLRRLLIRRFGPAPAWAEQRLADASTETLEQWADRLLEAESLEAVFAPLGNDSNPDA